ncbi:fasciclin domain-containing protein [Tautonia plasticadhaerens]|uniref:Immunogenic protein MPT70 n=1 Tax=Tautonia plasticadhaerens TaxID=2527974 RepID=A0A518H5N3_9BACT|nr:fasciclin domain-containing protein [Tautonia plasticadhaerens]QDV36154.1 Immunogenic protein MPT70 precursor [Tautonia plasticadhaerens]
MHPFVAPILALALASPAAAQEASKSLVEYVAEEPNFQTLYSYLKLSGLDKALEEGGPYTVFAPTDEAFAKLPKGTTDALAGDPEGLARILKFHVIPQEVMASDAKKAAGSEVKTLLEGCPLPISGRGEMLMVGKARVVKADVPATNGVIHVIDSVLLPPEQ